MKRLCLMMICIMPVALTAQQQLTLDECYTMAQSRSPLAEKSGLLARQIELDQAALAAKKLPGIAIGAQATYQSDVTFLPVDIPGMSLEPLSKDQYSATLTVSQPIYDGGSTKSSMSIQDALGGVRQKELEAHLYQLNIRINEYFFTALLAQTNLDDLSAKRELLESRRAEVASAVTYGQMDKSALRLIEVELMHADQALYTTDQNRKSALSSLYRLVGIVDSTWQIDLVVPDSLEEMAGDAPRPELVLFTLRQDLARARGTAIGSDLQPRLAAFATAGYGKPGLNFLENAFNPYYVVGLKFTWAPFDWNSARKRREALELEGALVEKDKAEFERNQEIELGKLETRLISLQNQMRADVEIIALHEEILHVRDAQLKNGTITPADYIDELTDLYTAKYSLNTHHIQYLHAQANYRITKGL